MRPRGPALALGLAKVVNAAAPDPDSIPTGQEQRPLLPATLRNADRETLLGRQWKSLPQSEKNKYCVGEASHYVFCREQRPLLPYYGLSHAETQKHLGPAALLRGAHLLWAWSPRAYSPRLLARPNSPGHSKVM